jgi:hypothetical protein
VQAGYDVCHRDSRNHLRDMRKELEITNRTFHNVYTSEYVHVPTHDLATSDQSYYPEYAIPDGSKSIMLLAHVVVVASRLRCMS